MATAASVAVGQTPAAEYHVPSDTKCAPSDDAHSLKPLSRTGLVYNSLMLLHQHPTQPHPESPLRIAHIFYLLKTSGYLAKMVRIPSREAIRSEIRRVHTEAVVSGVYNSALLPPEMLTEQAPNLENDSSLYLNQNSAFCARLSAGSLLELCDAVVSGRIRNGFAVIRPPGHHAEPNRSMGFCLFNNVAIAVRAMQDRYPGGEKAVKRVMVLDWDVHHGNGTQAVFNDDPSVLYVSLHRYDDGSFYPGGPFGSAESVGVGKGRGYSVNVPWPTYGMGDGDYLAAFDRVILPIANEYGPDLVIISAGFDAAKGDPLGLNLVSQAGYAHMTSRLAQIAGGRLVVALEGGYNVESIAPSALAVCRVLLGEAPPALPAGTIASPTARRTCEQVRRIHARFWVNLNDPDAAACDTDDIVAAFTSSDPSEPGHASKRRRLDAESSPWLRNEALGLAATDAQLLRLWREHVYWEHYRLTPLALPERPPYACSPQTSSPSSTSVDGAARLPLSASSWPIPGAPTDPPRRKRAFKTTRSAPLVHAMMPFDFFTAAHGQPADPCGSGVGHTHVSVSSSTGYRAVLLYVHDTGSYRINSDTSNPAHENGAPLDGAGVWHFNALPRPASLLSDASGGPTVPNGASEPPGISVSNGVGTHSRAPYTTLHTWARANRVAVVDVCALVAPVLTVPPPMRPYAEPYSGLSKDVASHWVQNLTSGSDSSPAPTTSIRDAITFATIAAFDETLSLLPPSVPRILVGAGSAGVDGIMGLLAARGTEGIKAVVQLAGMGAVPMTPGGTTVTAHLPPHRGVSHTDRSLMGKLQSEALKTFYHQNSLVILPHSHPATSKVGSTTQRYGSLYASRHKSPIRMVGHEMPRVAEFLEQKLGWAPTSSAISASVAPPLS